MRITSGTVADGIREQLFTVGTSPGCSGRPPARRGLPVGYYGLSQGGEMGMCLVAAEPRITAAVLGLIGSDWLADTAARITVPVEFVLQWDDEGNPRDFVMKLFDALGSDEKTLHADPGNFQSIIL